jgi:manganese/zinc/iron transport system permease protein
MENRWIDRMYLVDYFTDPILRAPTLGSMLMCLAAGLVGVIVFLRKQSLIGEALSHAAYPGVILGVILAGILEIDYHNTPLLPFFIMVGATCTALLGMRVIDILERKWKIRSDSALCFVLSSFFGVGLTLASHVQSSYSSLYQQIQVYLYGQAATMTDIHVYVYAVLASAIILAVIFLYKEVQMITFDREYTKSLGFRTASIETLFFVLIVLAIVIGIRSVGVVLMSAMLIAPAVAARQFSNKLYIIFILSGLFGLASGFLGNVFSVEITNNLLEAYPGTRLSIPTGPMIVVVGASICILALLIAPERGMLLRLVRIMRFRFRCMHENLLKTIWRISPTGVVLLDEIARYQSASKFYLKFVMMRLCHNGWVKNLGNNSYRLTHDGELWAAKIVRLHRLWEVYLVEYLGVGMERVHHNAEEMEHIITPELEKELTLLLKNPKQDPHQQPIPPLREI